MRSIGMLRDDDALPASVQRLAGFGAVRALRGSSVQIDGSVTMNRTGHNQHTSCHQKACAE